MYAIKIEIGKERIRVRNYNNGFLPSYTSCAEGSMGKRLFVVPGYIFTMTNTHGAEKVPDTDWKVIEAISDSHPSTLDTTTQNIIDGPLKGLLILRINPALKSVCIRAKLLGMTREYWLAVRFADDGKAKNVVKSEDKETEDKKMAKKADYTDEQIQKAIEKAKEIGIHAAGQELGIPWQTVLGFCKKAGVMEEASKKPAKKAKKISSSEPVVSPAIAPTVSPAVEEKTEKKEEKTSKRRRKAADSTSAVTPDVEEKTTVPAEKKPAQPASTLEIENAVLRKENEQLKAKIQKLQKALAELI